VRMFAGTRLQVEELCVFVVVVNELRVGLEIHDMQRQLKAHPALALQAHRKGVSVERHHIV